MSDHHRCLICGMRLDQNYNESNLKDPYGQVPVLCGRHHEVARRAAAEFGEVNWFALNDAEAALDGERPSLAETERWATFEPVERMMTLYRQFVADPEVQAAHEQQRQKAQAST